MGLRPRSRHFGVFQSKLGRDTKQGGFGHSKKFIQVRKARQMMVVEGGARRKAWEIVIENWVDGGFRVRSFEL